MNYEIIPALMPKNYDDIESSALLIRGFAKTMQLDLMDGRYVPEKTWPFMYENDYNLDDLKKEDGGFPIWEDVNYELDLMIERPEKDLDTWLHIGASRVIFHYASVHEWENIKNIDQTIRNFVDIGVAVTIHDNYEQLFPLIDEGVVDFVQVMGIAQIGYQGEAFDPQCLDIITALRSRYPELVISIDGGVSEETIAEISRAGVNRFVSGSGVFGHGIASENIEYLKSLISSLE